MKKYFRLLIFLSFFPAPFIFSAEPIISNILPRGGQIGSELKVVISGQRLGDAEEIFFYDKGITALDLNASGEKSVRVKFRISETARLGQHEMRLRTKSGISTVKTFWVGPYPNFHEKEPNTSFEEAQKVSLNRTINGLIKSEDVDYFEFNATKGQRISLEIEAIRLSGPLFDPYVAILDSNRFEVATSDDTDLLLQDSTLSVIAPEDGTYFVEVRESSYRGGNNFYYRLHLGNFPRPLIAFPAGGQAGKMLKVKFMGDPTGPIHKTIQLPEKADLSFGHRVEQDGFISPSPNKIRVCDFPSIREVEPNNSLKQATVTELSLPLAFDGVIEKEKGVHQELGGKSSNIILDDVADLEKSVKGGAGHCFLNSGQSCNAPTKMLVSAQNYDKAVEVAVQTAKSTTVGDPQGEFRIGPIANKAQYEKILRMIEIGIEEGAKLVAGGIEKPEGYEKGYYVKPTVFADVTNDMTKRAACPSRAIAARPRACRGHARCRWGGRSSHSEASEPGKLRDSVSARTIYKH